MGVEKAGLERMMEKVCAGMKRRGTRGRRCWRLLGAR
jgi:hypothetical protein